ncbi:MAG: RING finger domain-containing protein, partial [Candidatus Hodarchaeota archaeon]
YVETISTMTAGHFVVAGGTIDSDSAEGCFLLILSANNGKLAIANASASWFIMTPNRSLRNLLVFEIDEGKFSLIAAETEIGETYPVYLRVFDLHNYSSLVQQSEIILPTAAPIVFAKSPFPAPSIVDLIAAARVYNEPGNLSLFRISNNTSSFSWRSIGNFSQPVSQIFPTQLIASHSLLNNSSLVLLGEALEAGQSAVFFLRMDLHSDYAINRSHFAIYEQNAAILASSAAILLDIDGNGVNEVIWQLKVAPQGLKTEGQLLVMEMEDEPVYWANHTLGSSITQDISPKDLVLINEGQVLLSVGFAGSGTAQHGQIIAMTLQPIVMKIDMSKRLWTFEETLTTNLTCNWWQGQPIGALQVGITLTGPNQLVFFGSTVMTNENGLLECNINLSNISVPGLYNFSATAVSRGWEGRGDCSVWIDWTNELKVTKSIADSYGGRINGNFKLLNSFSRNETFYIRIHDPQGQLRNFQDHRSLTHSEESQNTSNGSLLSLLDGDGSSPVAWNNTSITFGSNEEVALFFKADSDVGKRISLELFINCTFFSQSFSFTVISKEIWFSPTFQIYALIGFLFVSLLIALMAYAGKKHLDTISFLNSLPQDRPIDISEALNRYGRSQEWMRRKIPRRIPGYFSITNPDKFLPECYLAAKTRELIELESVKTVQELAEQLSLDQEASRVLLAALHREVIEQDDRVLRDRVRVILSALTDFKTLAKADAKLKGLVLGPLASPEGPQAKARKPATCSFCGASLESTKKCQKCGNTVLQCSICRLSMDFGENTATCPECGSIFHQGHLEEWLKIKGSCPVCSHPF